MKYSMMFDKLKCFLGLLLNRLPNSVKRSAGICCFEKHCLKECKATFCFGKDHVKILVPKGSGRMFVLDVFICA